MEVDKNYLPKEELDVYVKSNQTLFSSNEAWSRSQRSKECRNAKIYGPVRLNLSTKSINYLTLFFLL